MTETSQKIFKIFSHQKLQINITLIFSLTQAAGNIDVEKND